MESHVEVYNCETYTGKASIAKVMYESFKPSEINSHGSGPGFFIMGFMQMRNYFYQYPPTGTCSMKAVLHRTQVNPAEAVEIKLKMDSAVPSGKKAAPGKTFSNVKGAVTLLGSPERKWNVEVNIEKEPFNIKSQVAVKIARLANPGLNVPSRALCVNVKTAWAALPEDIFETPSTIEPSVQREVSFVWGEAPSDQCPKANAKDISTILIKVQGNITEAQREAATSRNTYPYDRCDLDRNDAGRSGIVGPMTQVINGFIFLSFSFKKNNMIIILLGCYLFRLVTKLFCTTPLPVATFWTSTTPICLPVVRWLSLVSTLCLRPLCCPTGACMPLMALLPPPRKSLVLVTLN